MTLAALLAVGILPIGEILLRPLEAEFPPRAAPAHIDGIVALGGVEDQRATAAWGEPQLNEAAERLTAAAALAIAHPEARLVFSGGSGRLRNAVLGSARDPERCGGLLRVPGHRPRPDHLGRSIAQYSGERPVFLRGRRAAVGETWVLVTSAFHMGRALASFEAAGWRHDRPYPVDYRTGSFT